MNKKPIKSLIQLGLSPINGALKTIHHRGEFTLGSYTYVVIVDKNTDGWVVSYHIRGGGTVYIRSSIGLVKIKKIIQNSFK